MITESKVTEIFCIADDFCKEFETEMAKKALPSTAEAPKRNRIMSDSEVITILICFHLLCNEKGEIINFALTKANVDDRNESVIDTLTDKVFGKLWDDGIHIVTGLHSNMKQCLMPIYDKIMLRKRSVIESLNDMLKNVAQLVHTHHRSVHNFLMNLLGAMGAYCFFAVKPKVNFDFEVPQSDGQLILW